MTTKAAAIGIAAATPGMTAPSSTSPTPPEDSAMTATTRTIARLTRHVVRILLPVGAAVMCLVIEAAPRIHF